MGHSLYQGVVCFGVDLCVCEYFFHQSHGCGHVFAKACQSHVAAVCTYVYAVRAGEVIEFVLYLLCVFGRCAKECDVARCGYEQGVVVAAVVVHVGEAEHVVGDVPGVQQFDVVFGAEAGEVFVVVNKHRFNRLDF